MKKTLLITATLLLLFAFTPNVMAQGEEEESSNWNASLDIYSSYIWRGTKFGTGPAFQPGVEFSTGGFAIGGWGSVNAGSEEALEMDLYASYSIGGFSIGLTDYYFGGDWTSYDMNHYLEPSLSFGVGDFSIAGYYMFLPATEATDTDPATKFGENGDMYFEAAYSFKHFDITLGAGDGQYTSDGDFTICNIGVGTSKEINITESFSLPLSGAVILNPSTGGFFIVAGISL
jgi:hypothetical protein